MDATVTSEPPVSPSVSPSVSIVMITKDRRARVLDTLPRLLELPEQPQVIVVDDASSDGTTAAVSTVHPDVDIIRLPRSRGAAARTMGVQRARAGVVAFADDDSWWAPGALGRAVELFMRHPRLGLIAGRVLVGTDGREDPTNALMSDSPLDGDALPGPEVLGFVACGAVVRRTAYLAAGGFHPRFGLGGEEALLAVDLRRVGYRSAYVDDVVAHHHPASGDPRPARRRALMRNDLWTTWLRRPAGMVVRDTANAVRQAVTDADARASLAGAVRGVPWVLGDRSAVAADIEKDLRAIEAAR